MFYTKVQHGYFRSAIRYGDSSKMKMKLFSPLSDEAFPSLLSFLKNVNHLLEKSPSFSLISLFIERHEKAE